ncbi:DUF551 domain-containing protein [Escherichia coli]|nr:DUF551 domain-containing protein [Escherichia coli]QEP84920.1 DUF551 domain-containing protein [Escherichia coli]
MNTITKEQLIEELKASTQNASGMFEISEDTICALMSLLTNAAPQLPQQAVPDEIPEPDTARMFFTDAVVAIAKVQGWNACRAAILHSAEPVSQTYKLNELSGNSPVTPDGWISCSERMPNEEDVLVYCSDTKEQMVGFHKGKGLFQFFYMNGVEGVCEPSHWMPLPEPPQEVNRG